MSLTATSTSASRAALKSLRYGALLQGRRLSTALTTDVEDRDIVIVGGGPAGLALASALGVSSAAIIIGARLNPPGSSSSVRQNASVTLVEGGDLTKIKNWIPAPGTYSNRVVSLTNASQAFLKGNTTEHHILAQLIVWNRYRRMGIRRRGAHLPGGTHGGRSHYASSFLRTDFHLRSGMVYRTPA